LSFNTTFRKILDKAGQHTRLRYFNETIGSVWDDDVSLAISGNDLWVTGVIFPLNNSKGSVDSLLLEQGKLITSDKKIFLAGSIYLTGSDLQLKVQIGSPTGENYQLVADGGTVQEFNGINIYKRAFIRRLTNGSLIGEA